MATRQKQYILAGLCCGNCAAKIQHDIRRLNGISSAQIDPASATLSVEFDIDAETLAKEITRIATFYDEDIMVREA